MICHPSTIERDHGYKSTHRNLAFRHPSEQFVLPSKSSCDCHESPMTITPIPTVSSKKHVRFELLMDDIGHVNKKLRAIFDEVDDENRDETTTTTTDGCRVDDVCCPNNETLYWDTNDIKKNRVYAQRKAAVIRIKYPQEVEALESVICNKESNNAMTQQQYNHHRRSTNETLLNSTIQTEITTMHNWSSSYVRGLEDYMTPLLSSRRQTVLQQIIQYQSWLKQHEQQSNITEQRNHFLLCEFSRQLSEPSRNLALKLALGDALAASDDP